MKTACANFPLYAVLLAFATGVAISAQELGKVTNFQQLDSTQDTITLEWDLEKGDVDITFYAILIVEDQYEMRSRCNLEHCTFVVDFLNPCSEYHFEITPDFQGTKGDMSSTIGSTDDILPGEPLNLNIEGGGDPNVELTWEPPVKDPKCVEKYQVCTRLDGETHEDCFKTNQTKASLKKLQMCSLYHITVSGVTPLGSTGDVASTETVTKEGVPGKPQDLQIKEIGSTYVTVTYHSPLVNPLCVDSFYLTWDEGNFIHSRQNIHECDPICEDTLSPVPACSNLTIAVAASNPSEVYGEMSYVDVITEDLVPLEPSSVEIISVSPTEFRVKWIGNPGDDCDYVITICWIDEVQLDEYCDDVFVGDGDGSGIYNITQAYPCAGYEITVTVKSPSGLESKATRKTHHTSDIVPGPVMNLQIEEVGSTNVSFTYDMPIENPQCAVAIEDVYVDLTEQQSGLDSPSVISDRDFVSPNSHAYKDGLSACTDFLIRVRVISPSGLLSLPENVTTTTKSEMPSEPQKVTATHIGLNTATIEWVRPSTHSRCITAYKLTLSDGQTSQDIDIPTERVSPLKMKYELEGLTPCIDYNAQIVAISEEGSTVAVSTDFTTLCK